MQLNHTNYNEPFLFHQKGFVRFATCKGIQFYYSGQIIRCKASSNYTRIHFTNNKTLVVAKTLGDIENSLPSEFFLRIHRSDIINISHIRKQDNLGNLWLSDGTRLTMAKRRKTHVTKELQFLIH